MRQQRDALSRVQTAKTCGFANEGVHASCHGSGDYDHVQVMVMLVPCQCTRIPGICPSQITHSGIYPATLQPPGLKCSMTLAAPNHPAPHNFRA